MRIETDEDKEAKNLMTMIREQIYKDYKNTPHVEESYEGAINTVEDLVLIFYKSIQDYFDSKSIHRNQLIV
jgi:hypothetical protein